VRAEAAAAKGQLVELEKHHNTSWLPHWAGEASRVARQNVGPALQQAQDLAKQYTAQGSKAAQGLWSAHAKPAVERGLAFAKEKSGQLNAAIEGHAGASWPKLQAALGSAGAHAAAAAAAAHKAAVAVASAARKHALQAWHSEAVAAVRPTLEALARKAAAKARQVQAELETLLIRCVGAANLGLWGQLAGWAWLAVCVAYIPPHPFAVALPACIACHLDCHLTHPPHALPHTPAAACWPRATAQRLWPAGHMSLGWCAAAAFQCDNAFRFRCVVPATRLPFGFVCVTAASLLPSWTQPCFLECSQCACLASAGLRRPVCAAGHLWHATAGPAALGSQGTGECSSPAGLLQVSCWLLGAAGAWKGWLLPWATGLLHALAAEAAQ
jgi:hypothetical protein